MNSVDRLRRKPAYTPELNATSLEDDTIEACGPAARPVGTTASTESRTSRLNRRAAASLL